jgi:Concanavalin A-like lectin/glucanases superfamily
MRVQWTVSAWVNFAALPSTAGTWDYLIDRAGAANKSDYSIDIANIGGVITIETGFDGAGSTYAQYSGTVNTGTWYLLTGVYDATAAKVDLYENGFLVASQPTGSYTPTYGSGYDVGVGAGVYSGAGGYFLSGTLDDARVYNRALSASEVRDLYLATGGT